MTTLNVYNQFATVNAQQTTRIKPNAYGNFTINQLDTNFKTQFNTLLNQVLASALSDSHTVLSFKSDSAGFADKTYVSSVVKKDDQLAIHFGTEIINFKPELPSNINLSIESVVYDRYQELSLTIYDEDADITASFPLRLTEEAFKSMLETGPDGRKAINGRKLAVAMSKGKVSTVLEAISEGKTGGASEPLTDIKTLPEQTDFQVTRLKEVQVNYQGVAATSYIVTVAHEDANYSFWLPSNLKLSAEIGTLIEGTTKLGYYLTEVNKAGKQYVKGYIINQQVTVDVTPQIVETKVEVASEEYAESAPF